MKQFSTLVLMLLAFAAATAQTLVNRAWKATTGSPTLTYDYLAGYRGSNYVILVGNTYSPGQAENYLVSKYSFTGQLLWQTEFNTADNKSDIGFDLYIKGNGVYVTGSSIDTSTTDSDILTLKLSLDSGTIQWDTIYTGAYGGRSIALGITADNAGNAYVLGGEETGTFDSRMTVIKYDAYGQQQWTMHYDSVGNIDGAGAIELNDTTLTVTGFSGTAFGTWDFVTLTASANTGAIIGMRLDPNGNGGMQQLYSVTGHSSNNLHLTGSTLNSPANEDIKVICYDTLLNEKWVKTWGSPDSLMDRPRKIAMDGTGNVLVLGESRKPNGGSDIVLLSYNPNNGSLLWQRRISAANPAHHCKPADMVGMPSGLGGPIYVTGSAYTDAGGYDFITASFDASGNLRWTRTMNDTLNSDDQAGDIQYTGGGVVVSGISTLGGNSKYVSVKYEEFAKNDTLVFDTAGKPLYVKNQAIVLFDNSALKHDFVNDRELVYAKPDKVLGSAAYTYFSSRLPVSFGRCNFVKIFPELTEADSLMVTRLGDTVYAPPFYNAMQLVCNLNMDEQAVCDSFNRGFPLVKYAHLNFCASPSSDPNDFEFGAQTALHDMVLEPSSVNVLPAWDLETGDTSIRVGVVDDYIDGFHEDFGGTESTFLQGKVQGWDFINNMDLFAAKQQPLPPISQYPYYSQHGNLMSGTIGALRNNNIGVAGIAGGDGQGNNNGVSLYSVRTCNFESGTAGLYKANAFEITRGVYLSSLMGGSPYNYGLHVSNNSYGFLVSYGIDDRFKYDKFNLFRDAVHAVNRLGVVLVAARGQGNSDRFEYPGCYNDDWVLNISGTGSDGRWEHHFTFPRSRFGNIDLAAPSQANFTTSLIYDITNHASSYSYNLAAGTSSATSYVSGASALLLSYYNLDKPINQRLIHEDVEQILERSATPTGDSIEYVGAGRLNVADALYLVHQPERMVRHYRNIDTIILSDTLVLVDTALLIKLNEPVTYYDVLSNFNDTILNPYLDTGLYKMEVYKYSTWVPHAYPSTDSMLAYWPLHSRTQTWNLYVYDSATATNYLQPYEKCYIDSISRNYAVLSGYFYKVRNAQTDSLIRWLPYPPMQEEPRMSYSVLTNDNTYIPTGIRQPLGIKTWLYPNPAREMSYLSVTTDIRQDVSIKMYDVVGRVVRDIYRGPIDMMKSFEIPLHDLQKGMYVVGIETKAGMKTIKMTKL